MNDYFLVGIIHSIFNNEGWLRVISFSDFPERFSKLKFVYMDFFGEKKKIKVIESKWHKNSLLLKLENFLDSDNCSLLIGKELFVDSDNLVKLPKGYNFIHDLIGLEVFQVDRRLGVVKDVMQFPANDIYVVESLDGKEILIPVVKSLIEKIDLTNKKILLNNSISFDD